MENITEELDKLKIKKNINIDEINNLMKSIEEAKPIPLIFYNKNLTELKFTKMKCKMCKRLGQYKCENMIYCWIHAHSLV